MDKLREKPGIVAVGAAALATAGYLLYKSFNSAGDKSGVDDAQSVVDDPQGAETEPDVVLENSFFLDAGAPAR